MPKVIISDTSCFIVLSKIGELELLRKLNERIITSTEIAMEFGEPLPNWVEILSVNNRARLEILGVNIDLGESSAIALAFEIPETVVVLDDIKARKIATQLGLLITGTIGIIVKAKLKGIIPSIKPILEKIKSTDFRLSKELEYLALRAANEE